MELLRCRSDEEFQAAIAKITKASLTEYVVMMLGRGMPTRADEIKQHRLFHLIKFYFDRRIPTETDVGTMFQLTDSESKSLIRNVRTRFRLELEEEIQFTLRATVIAAEQVGDDYEAVIHSDNVLEELNRIIDANAPGLEHIFRVRGCARKFRIPIDTYNFLRDHFNLDIDTEGEEIEGQETA